MKQLYKCTYTPDQGVSCPVMWKYKKPKPKHCFEYDCEIWAINPEKTCRFCISLSEGETPQPKVWCNEAPYCDSFNDGGIEKCMKCSNINRRMCF